MADVAQQNRISKDFSSNFSIMPNSIKYNVIQSVPSIVEMIINESSYYGGTEPASFASTLLCQTLYICYNS